MMAWWLATTVSWAVTGAGHTGTPSAPGGTGAHSAATYPHTGWTQETGGTPTPGHSGGSGHSGGKTHSEPTYPTDETDGTTTDTGDEKHGPCSCATGGPDPVLALVVGAIVGVRRSRSRRNGT